MRKIVIVLLLIVGLVSSFSGCKKKEEQKPSLPAGHPGMGTELPGAHGTPKAQRTIVVPKDVKAKWKAVNLIIEDKATKKTKEYKIGLGSTLDVPTTNVTIKVLTFLPHFVMGNTEITSVSNEPKMPAAQISVTEPGKEAWEGWVFALHPDMHPYQHDKIAIKLGGGVSK